MPTTYKVTHDSFEVIVNRERNIAHIIFSGEIGIEEVKNAYLALIDHPTFKYNMNVCNDYSNAILLVSILELQEHAVFVSQYSEQRGSTYKLAMVSNETISSAFLSMYKVRISKSKVDSGIFGSTKSALRWLKN